MRRVKLDGWEMTKGSFSNKELGVTLERSWDYSSRKAFWVLKHEGKKSERFPTVFEAVSTLYNRLENVIQERSRASLVSMN